MTQQEWFTCGELAEHRLPAMPHSERGVAQFADKNDWLRADWEGTHWRPRPGRGRGIEFHVRLLRPEIQAELRVRLGAAETEARIAMAKDQGQFDALWRRWHPES